MAVENTLIQIHKACEPILGFLGFFNSGSGAAILASSLTFWLSRRSAEADRKQKIKDCRESFQKILPNYIERIKEMIETLNSERIRLSGENAEGPNTGSLASGKLLEGCLSVRLEFITNLPLTDFFSYPEVVEAYSDKSHKSKLSHVRKTELIHDIFGTFESICRTQIDFINLRNDSKKERLEYITSFQLHFLKLSQKLQILGNMSDSHRELISTLETELKSEYKKTPRDFGRENEILKDFREKKLVNSVPESQFNHELLQATPFLLSEAIVSHHSTFHTLIAIEEEILANFENTHNSLESQLKHLKLNFEELGGEQNGDNVRVKRLLNFFGKITPFLRKNAPLKFFYILVKGVGFFLLYLYLHPLL